MFSNFGFKKSPICDDLCNMLAIHGQSLLPWQVLHHKLAIFWALFVFSTPVEVSWLYLYIFVDKHCDHNDFLDLIHISTAPRSSSCKDLRAVNTNHHYLLGVKILSLMSSHIASSVHVGSPHEHCFIDNRRVQHYLLLPKVPLTLHFHFQWLHSTKNFTPHGIFTSHTLARRGISQINSQVQVFPPNAKGRMVLADINIQEGLPCLHIVIPWSRQQVKNQYEDSTMHHRAFNSSSLLLFLPW